MKVTVLWTSNQPPSGDAVSGGVVSGGVVWVAKYQAEMFGFSYVWLGFSGCHIMGCDILYNAVAIRCGTSTSLNVITCIFTIALIVSEI